MPSRIQELELEIAKLSGELNDLRKESAGEPVPNYTFVLDDGGENLLTE